MSCVVGIKSKDRIYIGGDSFASSDGDIREIINPKVFRNKHILIGFCGSLISGQLLTPKLWTPPTDIPLLSLSIKKHLEDHDCTVDADADTTKYSHANFLIAFKGTLIQIYADFSVSEFKEDYTAIGSGKHFALGSLYETKHLNPKIRIKKAIQCASYFRGDVGGKIIIKSIGN